MITLAVFDIAGTTVEEHNLVYAALGDAVRAVRATPTTQDIERWMGADKREAISALIGSTDRKEIEDIFLDFRDRLDDYYDATPPTPLHGVSELFRDLRANGVQIALTTGFDDSITTPLLERLGWNNGTVDAVVCADDVPSGRPAPYMIFRAMERTGVTDVRNVLTAGDTPRDVLAGLSAGAGRVVGVRTGGLPTEALQLESRVEVLGSLADLVV